MSVADAGVQQDPVELEQALELHEAAVPQALQEGLDADGSVLIHVIRPGVGRGRGKHLYEAKMLQENATKFAGWPMYIDHLSAEARKKLQGLPRSMNDAGGVIKESWWDPTVPADAENGWDAGAVVARVKPIGFAKTLVEEAPEIVGASISTTATGVKPATRNGQRVWLVEGIADKGSVDWVTEAGAGGRVVSLLEAAYHSEEEQDKQMLETLTDDQLREYLAEHRGELLEALAVDAGDNEGTTETGGGMSEQQIGEQITADVLQEALQREGIIDQLNEAITVVVGQRVEEAIQGGLEEAFKEGLEEKVRPLVEQVVEDERETIHAEARAQAGRAVKLRDLRDTAHRQVQESRLPESWKAEVRTKFDLEESGPTKGLDVVDEIDPETGDVVKTAEQVLTESVDTEIKRQRELLAAVQPTRVRGQGPRRSGDNDDNNGKGGEGESTKPAEGTLYGAVLQEAGIDPNTAYEQA